MKYDIIATTRAAACLKALEDGYGTDAGAISQLADELVAGIEELVVPLDGWSRSKDVQDRIRSTVGVDDVVELAWKAGSMRPVDLPDMWSALVCLDLGTRERLRSVLGEQQAHSVHREAASAVLGETVVVRLVQVRQYRGRGD